MPGVHPCRPVQEPLDSALSCERDPHTAEPTNGQRWTQFFPGPSWREDQPSLQDEWKVSNHSPTENRELITRNRFLQRSGWNSGYSSHPVLRTRQFLRQRFFAIPVAQWYRHEEARSCSPAIPSELPLPPSCGRQLQLKTF